MLAAAIFEPLGKSDTTYHLSDEQRSRLTPVHAKDETGSWIATDVDYAQRPQLIPGGHGLYSTAEDYLKFQRALLGGGELDGARILSSDCSTACSWSVRERTGVPLIVGAAAVRVFELSATGSEKSPPSATPEIQADCSPVPGAFRV